MIAVPQRTSPPRPAFEEAARRCLPVIGRSRAMHELLELLESLAGTDTPVLVTGESGSGKEHVARLLHETGERSGPYLAHNCAALAEGTLESDLFGHAAGSFTGAAGMRRGLFEEADGGTLFLDEIGDVGAKLQAQLLRVLQEGEIRRVGESRSRKVDVRVLAATHRDLPEEVRTGRFREDLFYRLNLVQVRVPALRERRADIPLFVRHFLAESVRGDEPMSEVIEPRAMERLLAHPWPGNVRQLRNEILRAAILTRGRRTIGPDDFSEEVRGVTGGGPADGSLRERVEAAQRAIVLEALRGHAWNKTRAARRLGISRQGLIKMMHRLELPLGGAEAC
jgi:DNA-binding NtrC family response regulator